MEWYPVYYNGLKTNVEVTKCSKVRRVKVNFTKKKTKVGDVDFTKIKITPDKYRCISIYIEVVNSRTVKVHQLMASAFLDYKFNGFKLVVDHIDGNTLNNDLSNLQVITNRENCSRARSLKKGLPTGVTFNKRDKKYQSQIQINGKINYLGLFNTIEEASNAYKNKLKSIVI